MHACIDSQQTSRCSRSHYSRLYKPPKPRRLPEFPAIGSASLCVLHRSPQLGSTGPKTSTVSWRHRRTFPPTAAYEPSALCVVVREEAWTNLDTFLCVLQWPQFTVATTLRHRPSTLLTTKTLFARRLCRRHRLRHRRRHRVHPGPRSPPTPTKKKISPRLRPIFSSKTRKTPGPRHRHRHRSQSLSIRPRHRLTSHQSRAQAHRRS